MARARLVFCPGCSREYNLNSYDHDDETTFRCPQCGGPTE